MANYKVSIGSYYDAYPRTFPSLDKARAFAGSMSNKGGMFYIYETNQPGPYSPSECGIVVGHTWLAGLGGHGIRRKFNEKGKLIYPKNR